MLRCECLGWAEGRGGGAVCLWGVEVGLCGWRWVGGPELVEQLLLPLQVVWVVHLHRCLHAVGRHLLAALRPAALGLGRLAADRCGPPGSVLGDPRLPGLRPVGVSALLPLLRHWLLLRVEVLLVVLQVVVAMQVGLGGESLLRAGLDGAREALGMGQRWGRLLRGGWEGVALTGAGGGGGGR